MCAFFTKIPEDAVAHPIVHTNLRFLTLETPFYTVNEASIRQARKKSQPEIVWEDLDDAVVAARIAAVLQATPPNCNNNNNNNNNNNPPTFFYYSPPILPRPGPVRTMMIGGVVFVLGWRHGVEGQFVLQKQNFQQ